MKEEGVSRMDVHTPPGPRVHRSRKAFLGVLVSVLLIGVIGGGLWWYSFVRSPAYSIGRLARAVETRDWAGFETYVDVDSVVSSAVDDSVDDLVNPDSDLGRLAASIGDAVKPALVQQSKNVLKRTIESGRVRFDNRLGPLGSHAVAMRVETVERGEDVAVVRVPVPVAGKRIDLLLRMERVGEYWQVVRIENPEDLPLADLGE